MSEEKPELTTTDQLKKYLFSKTSAAILAGLTALIGRYSHSYLPTNSSKIQLPLPNGVNAAQFTQVQDDVWIVQPLKEYVILTKDPDGNFRFIDSAN